MSSATGASTSDSQISASLSDESVLSPFEQLLVDEISRFQAREEIGIQTRHSIKNLNRDQIYKIVACTECGEGFHDDINLRCHYKAIHGGREFKCNICNNTGYKTHEILDLHLETEHFNQQTFYCEICITAFAENSDFNMESHMREHELSNGVATTSQNPPIKLLFKSCSNGLTVTNNFQPSTSGTNLHASSSSASSALTVTNNAQPSTSGPSSLGSASGSNGGAFYSVNDPQPSTSRVNSSNHSAISHTNGVSTDSVPSNSASSLQQPVEPQPAISNGQPNKRPLYPEKTPAVSVNGDVSGSLSSSESTNHNANSPPQPLKKCKRNNIVGSDGKQRFFSCHKCSSLFFNEEKLKEHMKFHRESKNSSKRPKLATNDVTNGVTVPKIAQKAASSSEVQLLAQPSTSTIKVNSNESQAEVSVIEPNLAPNNATQPQSEASITKDDSSELPVAPALEFEDGKDPKDPSTSETSKLKCRKKGTLSPAEINKWICPKCTVGFNSAYQYCYHIFNSHVRNSLKKENKNCNDCEKMLDEAQKFFSDLTAHLKKSHPAHFKRRSPARQKPVASSPAIQSGAQPISAPSTSKAGGKQPLVHDKSDSNDSTEVIDQSDFSDYITIDSGEEDEDDDVILDEMDAEIWKKKTSRIASFFSCKVCRHTTQCPKQIAAHVLTHEGAPTDSYRAMFRCEFCKMCFARRCTLLLHRLKHLKQKALHCEFCSRPFATPKALAKHHSAHVKHSMKAKEQKDGKTEQSTLDDDSSHEFGPGTSGTASASSSSASALSTPAGKQPTPSMASASTSTLTQTPNQTRASPALPSTILRAAPKAASTPIVINTHPIQTSTAAHLSRPSVSPVKSGHPTNKHHHGHLRHKTLSSQREQSPALNSQVQTQGPQPGSLQQSSQPKPSPQRAPIPIQQQVPSSFSSPQPRLITSGVRIQARPPVPIFATPQASGHAMPQQQQLSSPVVRINLASNQMNQSVPISTMAHASIPMQQQAPQVYQMAALQQQQGIQNAPSRVQYLQRVPSPANQGQSMTQQPIHLVQRPVQHTTPTGQPIQQILMNAQMVSQPSSTQYGPIQQLRPQIFVQPTNQQRPQNMMPQQNIQISPRGQIMRGAQIVLQASQIQQNQRTHLNPQQQQNSPTITQNQQQQFLQQANLNSRPVVVSSVPVVSTSQQQLFQQPQQLQQQQQQQQQQQRLHIQVTQGQQPIRYNSPTTQQQTQQPIGQNPSIQQQHGQQPIRQHPSSIPQQQGPQQMRQHPMQIQQQQAQHLIRQNPSPLHQQQSQQPIGQNPSIQQQHGQQQPIRQLHMSSIPQQGQQVVQNPLLAQQQQGQHAIRHNSPTTQQQGQHLIRQNPSPLHQQQSQQPIGQNPSIQQQHGQQQPIRQLPMSSIPQQGQRQVVQNPLLAQQQQGQHAIRQNSTPNQQQNGQQPSQQHRPVHGPHNRPGVHHGQHRRVAHGKHNPNAHRPSPINIKQENAE